MFFDQPPTITQSQAHLQEVKQEAPIIVKIIALFMLIGGISGLLIAVFSLFPLFHPNLLKITIASIESIILSVSSFGVRQMRRWGLYTYTALTIGTLLYSIPRALSSHLTSLNIVVFLALPLVYLWTINKRFK